MIAGAPTPRLRGAAGVVSLRRATASDASRVLAWNNAPDVRARSLDPRPIAADDHARWFEARLRDPAGRLWIALIDGNPVGVVRIDRTGGAAPRPTGEAGRVPTPGRFAARIDRAAADPRPKRDSAADRARRDTDEPRSRRVSRSDLPTGRISIVLDPSVRGRGLGRRVIGLACAADGGPVEAEILADNHVSRVAFEAAGFVRQPDSSPDGATRAVVRYLWRPRRVHLV